MMKILVLIVGSVPEHITTIAEHITTVAERIITVAERSRGIELKAPQERNYA